MDPREDLGNHKCASKVAKLTKIFSTDSIIKISDCESFTKEGKSYLEFALNYKTPQMKSTAATNNTQAMEAVDGEGEISL